MSRLIRFSLWTIGIFAIIITALLFWVESQLAPEPLGKRIQGLLADAGIQGGITRIEASLDGSFSADGINLTLADGTKLALASIKGEADLIASIFGTWTLLNLEIKSLQIDLSQRQAKPESSSPAKTEPVKLPHIVLGPYSVTGRITLPSTTMIRFNFKGEKIDTLGSADIRAGLIWPSTTIGNQVTQPLGEVVLSANFRRPFGGQGIEMDDLIADIETLRLELTAKDTSPTSVGSVNFILEAAANGNQAGTQIKGTLSDTSDKPAVKFKGQHLTGTTQVEVELDLDPARFGVLAKPLPNIRLTGKVLGKLTKADWQADADLKMLLPEPKRLSPGLPPGGQSEWQIIAQAKKAPEGFMLNQLLIKGNGVTINVPQKLTWNGSLLPVNANDATISISADNTDLTLLNPFLAYADIIATSGRWSGEASVSFKDGQPNLTNIRTHSLRGVTLLRAGNPLVEQIDAQLPVKSDNGTLSLAPFKVSCPAGEIIQGSLKLQLGVNGAWSLNADVDLGIVELASQPNWKNLPVDKLKGIRIRANVALDKSVNQPVQITTAVARILRQDAPLLNLKLRRALLLDGTEPVGVLFEASARDLPLESIAAIIPNLQLSGDLKQADIEAGFKSDGFFVRTQAAPLSFIGTSLGWAGKSYIKDCDLTGKLEVLLGDKSKFGFKNSSDAKSASAVDQSMLIAFDKAELKCRNRLLAGGDIRFSLGASGTTLQLSGDLGALAEQPFAGPLNIVTGGQYQASAQRAPNGEIKLNLKVMNVGLRSSEGRIATAELSGSLLPKSDGIESTGTFVVQASQISQGSFSLTQKQSDKLNVWKAILSVSKIDIDDLLTLMPKGEESKTPEAPRTTTPDRAPFWAGHRGSLHLTVGTGKAYGINAQNLELLAEADENTIHLIQLSGKVAEGSIHGKGRLIFEPKPNKEPYSLTATVGLKQFSFSELASIVPAANDFVQGNATASATLTSSSNTAGELAAHLQIDSTLESQGGRIRAFGDKNSSIASFANKGAQVTELLGTLAILGGVIAKNEDGAKAAKIGTAMTAAAKLQKALADFNYTSATIKASRLATGTIRLDVADIRNDTLQLTAKGGIRVEPTLPFADWPLSFSTQLRGKGEFADSFQILGFGNAASPADGFTDGPTVKVTGSINQVHTDLKEKLQAAIDRAIGKSTPPQAAPDGQPVPSQNNSTPPSRKSGNLSDLLKELGGR